jgi:hypothetical protein
MAREFQQSYLCRLTQSLARPIRSPSRGLSCEHSADPRLPTTSSSSNAFSPRTYVLSTLRLSGYVFSVVIPQSRFEDDDDDDDEYEDD